MQNRKKNLVNHLSPVASLLLIGSCTADGHLTKTFTFSSHFFHIVSRFAQDGFFSYLMLKLNMKESNESRMSEQIRFAICVMFFLYNLSSKYIFKYNFLHLLSKLSKHCYCRQILKVPFSFDAAARRKTAARDGED